jgi:hypothetical protein
VELLFEEVEATPGPTWRRAEVASVGSNLAVGLTLCLAPQGLSVAVLGPNNFSSRGTRNHAPRDGLGA